MTTTSNYTKIRIMVSQSDWTIVFYTQEDGSQPVRAFLDSLDEKTQARFAWSLEQLRIRNIQSTEPLVRHVDGKLWELRRASIGNIYRLMYFFFIGRHIVVVHGFQKKTQKTPRKEIEIAQARMIEFLNKSKGGK